VLEVNEVQRTEALLADAIRMLREPAVTYSRAAAAAVVVEALRLYRRAVEGQRVASRVLGAESRPAPRDAYRWQGSLTEPSGAGAFAIRTQTLQRQEALSS